MDKEALKSWLRGSDEEYKLLEGLAKAVGESPGDDATQDYASTQSVGKELGLGQHDVQEHTRGLEARGLIRGSGRVSGGHQPTALARTILRELQQSRASGPDRYEHTAREILHRMSGEGRDVTWDEVVSWDLHEPGLPEVGERERETCMEALEKLGYIKGVHSAQQRFVRNRLEAKGELALGRPGVSLVDGLFDVSSVTNVDQRSGVHGSLYNHGGAVQIGNHNTQYVTINEDQRRQVLTLVKSLKGLLDENPGYDDVAREAVHQSLEEIGVEANGNGDPSVIKGLAQKALGAAAVAVGTEGGSAIVQALGRLTTLL